MNRKSPAAAPESLPSRMGGWRAIAGFALLALALGALVRSDLSHLNWVAELSRQGSPPPARDLHSDTGYVSSQRYFLATHERGETYRWIEDTQDLLARGPFRPTRYESDTVPTGRPRLQPTLYAGWLATLATAAHLVTGEPASIAVERAALWEPIVTHLLVFAVAVWFCWRRYGAAWAVVAALGVAFCPPVFGQFLPGVLTARNGALLLATLALCLQIPPARDDGRHRPLSAASAVVGGLAIWLDPTFGFPAVLLAGMAGTAMAFTRAATQPVLRWSVVGAATTLAGWLVDRAPWDPAAGEFRYVHPLYALAWLGLGLLLYAIPRWRSPGRARRFWPACVAGVMLIGPLFYIQIKHDYPGWLYASGPMRRLTSLDENIAYEHGWGWIADASPVEVLLVSLPVIAALALLAVALARPRRDRGTPNGALPVAVLFVGVVIFATARVRWGIPAILLALPVLAYSQSRIPARIGRLVLLGVGAYAAVLIAWNLALPRAFARPAAGTEPGAGDIEALAYRHFAYWLTAHTPGERVAVMAPPELSDSLVFHGGRSVLMSTAWESYPGQVAASRILSAPEASEADAVLQSRDITHLVLLSWDKAIPLLVRAPQAPGQTTLYARLQRWVLPPYLRPIPYHLPPIPGLADQKLTLFRVIPPQDEPLNLSQLAEYFIEMNRLDLAELVLPVLARVYPDNPNAVIARATIQVQARRMPEFQRELSVLATDAAAGRTPFTWDRRVQRAILLAIAHRTELARHEIAACIATASREQLMELTPLQAHRLRLLAEHFGARFADPELAPVLAAIGAEYGAAGTPPAP